MSEKAKEGKVGDLCSKRQQTRELFTVNDQNRAIIRIIQNFFVIRASVGYRFPLPFTAVSTKVVPQSVKANATMPIGIMGRESLALIE